MDNQKVSKANPPSPEIIKQEEVRLLKEHPTPEDIPGCMKLFDNFLLCNGLPIFYVTKMKIC